ncbi:unnamed protein product [Pleuronectes platessa]|uniref:Uncharacterized protein n=1 Tax=Pleuronectes platessa TaxID=8262 RepID=A0A9N7VEG0_PLEPL|nr:unnamed protein product [Pleuronectes platessa]
MRSGDASVGQEAGCIETGRAGAEAAQRGHTHGQERSRSGGLKGDVSAKQPADSVPAERGRECRRQSWQEGRGPQAPRGWARQEAMRVERGGGRGSPRPGPAGARVQVREGRATRLTRAERDKAGVGRNQRERDRRGETDMSVASGPGPGPPGKETGGRRRRGLGAPSLGAEKRASAERARKGAERSRSRHRRSRQPKEGAQAAADGSVMENGAVKLGRGERVSGGGTNAATETGEKAW